MSETPQQRGPHGRLYGRSKGKALRKHQAALVAEFLPRLSLDLSQPPAPSTRETHLEIGFGGGEHLIAAATENPEVDFIGCEPFINGVAKLLARIEERGLTNIRLHQGDAVDVLDWLPADSLSRVYLFYPDPWPKRRHRKRRFIARNNLDRLARTMRSGAELRFATDIDDYAAWTLARVRAHSAFAWRARRGDDWLTPWPGWTRTKYEAKAMAQGRNPVYLTFVRAQR
jgi:tRNA (guanine-N7-)-methyltransferase